MNSTTDKTLFSLLADDKAQAASNPFVKKPMEMQEGKMLEMSTKAVEVFVTESMPRTC